MTLLKENSAKFFFILIAVTLINIIQGRYTELITDEAYYWTYSNFLDWGFFDHPPMVAIWISISKFFFNHTELSVRFFSAISFMASVFLVWKTIDNPKKENHIGYFFLVVLSSVLFSVYGFITVPDTPLLLFFALFLFGYKQYLKNPNTFSYIIIIISVVGLLYSKYQAILILFFVILSNFKLLKDYKIWISFFVILLLFAPHIYWQYNHNFVTVKYHLVDRSIKSNYHISDTLMHFANCVAIIGPTFPLVYFAAYKNFKNKDIFNKSLNFIIVGFIIFFFLMSFKGPVQAQWILPITIPLILLSFDYFLKNPKFYELFKKLAIITICLIGIIRALIVVDVLPVQLDFHGNKKWVLTLKEKLKNRTPIFIDSYQKTSLFWFYSGIQPLQYNSKRSRDNQYNLYPFNNSFTIENGLAIGVLKPFAQDSITEKNSKKFYLREVKNFSIINNLDVEYSDVVTISEGQNNMPIVLKNLQNNFSLANKNIYVCFFDKQLNYLTEAKATFSKTTTNAGENASIELQFILPEGYKNSKIKYLKLGFMPTRGLILKGIGNYKKCKLK